MSLLLVVVSILFLGASDLIANGIHQDLLNPVSVEVPVQTAVTLTPIPGHHFNLKAPHSCDRGELVSFSETQLQCRLKTVGSYRLRVGICDDAKTFCKLQSVDVKAVSSKSK